MKLFVDVQGDILFLKMGQEPVRNGEVVVFNVDVSRAYKRLRLLRASKLRMWPDVDSAMPVV